MPGGPVPPVSSDGYENAPGEQTYESYGANTSPPKEKSEEAPTETEQNKPPPPVKPETPQPPTRQTSPRSTGRDGNQDSRDRRGGSSPTCQDCAFSRGSGFAFVSGSRGPSGSAFGPNIRSAIMYRFATTTPYAR